MNSEPTPSQIPSQIPSQTPSLTPSPPSSPEPSGNQSVPSVTPSPPSTPVATDLSFNPVPEDTTTTHVSPHNSDVSSSDLNSDSEIDSDSDLDSNRSATPPPILDEDEDAPPVATRFAQQMSSVEIQQQSILATRDALTKLGHQQAEKELSDQKLDNFISRLKTELNDHPCHIDMSIDRDDLDLSQEYEEPHQAFRQLKIPKSNLGLRRYILQQALYKSLLENKLNITQKNLSETDQSLKETEEQESDWVAQLDQADKNLTKVTRYWECRYNTISSINNRQKTVISLGLTFSIISLLLLQYINWYGTDNIVYLVQTIVSLILDGVQYCVHNPLYTLLFVMGSYILVTRIGTPSKDPKKVKTK